LAQLYTMTKTLLKTKKPNRLEVFECRETSVAPMHFEYIKLPMAYNLQDSISKWIKLNLRGRYYIGKSLSLGEKGVSNMDTTLRVGFEEPKELSYFTLACPLLKYK
jgi:hypothetical protein